MGGETGGGVDASARMGGEFEMRRRPRHRLGHGAQDYRW